MITYNSVEEWRNKATELYGPDKRQWQFKCCNCGHVQSIADFELLGVPEPENKVFFSCIGRWMPEAQGTIGNKKTPCNYTLGGLFVLNKAQVITNNEKTPVFEFSKP